MELFELTVHEIQQRLARKEFSSEELAKSVFSRIYEVEDKVKAFVTLIEERALARARKIDEESQFSGLAGIPYGLKDLFCTCGVRTTCSSRMLEKFVPTYDSTASRRLDENGAVLIGKLNMDEFAMGSSTENSAFFPTRNPWDLSRVPGGSSGGSAAAVAAGELPFALGSDTGGSIRQPASFCGVVGFKPTYGRVSRWGVAAFASSLDQVGVLAREVRDCALVMNVVAGHDPLDSTSVKLEVPDYTSFLDGEVKGLRIAFHREYFQQGVDEGVQELVTKALQKFEDLGAIVEEVSLPYSEALRAIL